eukprot:6196756-Pleurochrysis_carterae.AAC.2
MSVWHSAFNVSTRAFPTTIPKFSAERGHGAKYSSKGLDRHSSLQWMCQYAEGVGLVSLSILYMQLAAVKLPPPPPPPPLQPPCPQQPAAALQLAALRRALRTLVPNLRVRQFCIRLRRARATTGRIRPARSEQRASAQRCGRQNQHSHRHRRSVTGASMPRRPCLPRKRRGRDAFAPLAAAASASHRGAGAGHIST